VEKKDMTKRKEKKKWKRWYWAWAFRGLCYVIDKNQNKSLLVGSAYWARACTCFFRVFNKLCRLYFKK
jgi:hypothetical protein